MSTGESPLPSRMQLRLDEAIARAVHPVEQACLRAERAGHLAQRGQFDQAKAEIELLHAQFDSNPHPAVSSWLSLAEGYFAFFSGSTIVARDKIKRAHALSSASRLPRIQALSAAWLAHTDYVALDFPAMAANLQQTFKLASSDHRSAHARACLTTGTALHFAERLDLAKPWYARTREHASAAGDEVMLIGLGSNMAWHHGMHALQASIFGGALTDHARYAMAGAISVDNLDHWSGTTSLNSWAPMLRALSLSVQGEAAQALALYQTHLGDARTQGMGRLSPVFLADMAWCRWRVGDAEGARAGAHDAQSQLSASQFPDDCAVVHGRLSQVFGSLKEHELAQTHRTRAQEQWAAHRALQAQVLKLLDDWKVP